MDGRLEMSSSSLSRPHWHTLAETSHLWAGETDHRTLDRAHSDSDGFSAHDGIAVRVGFVPCMKSWETTVDSATGA